MQAEGRRFDSGHLHHTAKQHFAHNDIRIEPRKKESKEKVPRAWEGCLGTHSRRKTSPAAKDHGEPQAGLDPWVSEWGNPSGLKPDTPEEERNLVK